MDSKIEKKIEKEVGKEIAEEIKIDVNKEVEKQVEEGVKEVEKAVRKEVEKKLHIKLYKGVKDSAFRFKNELKNQIVIAVSAALGFLIALSWREPIQKSITLLVDKIGLKGSAIYFEYLVALVVTLIAVFILMFVSRWNVKQS